MAASGDSKAGRRPIPIKWSKVACYYALHKCLNQKRTELIVHNENCSFSDFTSLNIIYRCRLFNVCCRLLFCGINYTEY